VKKRKKIAFDLDGVIIDKPPIIPKRLLEWLFCGGGKNGLHYRYPKTRLERTIRKISHYYLFRPPIKGNVEFIKKMAKDPSLEFYVISGRYSFLEKETKNWLEKNKISKFFTQIFLNLNDEQPHLYKEKILGNLKPDIFIDDDLLLVNFLTKKINNCKIFCFLSSGKIRTKTRVLKEGQLIKILEE